ncbi:MAG: hypothetical protein KBS62_08185 [Oscillospiraceae bacterium]|nr:hypothetical protein [Candidatus Ruminococcus equi]
MALDSRQIDLTSVYEIIETKIIPTLKDEYERDGRKASGDLIRSLDNFVMDYDNGVYTMSLNLPIYWRSLEYGRPPTDGHTGIRWHNPTKDIEQWLVSKHITPPGRMSLRSFAFIIARKINQMGFAGKASLQRSISLCDSRGYFNDIESDLATQLMRPVIMDVDAL